MLRYAALAAAALLAGCNRERPADTGAIEVTAIGSFAARPDAQREPLSAPDRLLIGAVSPGLLTFSANGDVLPGLAQRWRISDDGLSYLFSLAPPDGGSEPVTAKLIADHLADVLAPDSRNPLKPYLQVIANADGFAQGTATRYRLGISAATDDVLELKLSEPSHALLGLLAYPELALPSHGKAGSGPYRISGRDKTSRSLTPTDDTHRAIRLTAADAAAAIGRFLHGKTAMVTGGDAGNLFLARKVAMRDTLRIDPVTGVYGYRVVSIRGALADAGLRRALALAVDRDAIVTALGSPTVKPMSGLIPPSLHGELDSAAANLVEPAFDQRLAAARALIGGNPPRTDKRITLKVALPPGTGHRLILAQVAAGWAQLGVRVEPVAIDARDADLRLIDEVTVTNLIPFLLQPFACVRAQGSPCSADADALIAQARTSTDPAQQVQLLWQADRLLSDQTPLIALFTPVRWSLVRPGLGGYADTSTAIHPLAEIGAVQGRK